jgi:hypothetical protein
LDVVFGKVEVKGERPPGPMEEERSIEEYRNFLLAGLQSVGQFHHDRQSWPPGLDEYKLVHPVPD